MPRYSSSSATPTDSRWTALKKHSWHAGHRDQAVDDDHAGGAHDHGRPPALAPGTAAAGPAPGSAERAQRRRSGPVTAAPGVQPASISEVANVPDVPKVAADMSARTRPAPPDPARMRTLLTRLVTVRPETFYAHDTRVAAGKESTWFSLMTPRWPSPAPRRWSTPSRDDVDEPAELLPDIGGPRRVRRDVAVDRRRAHDAAELDAVRAPASAAGPALAVRRGRGGRDRQRAAARGPRAAPAGQARQLGLPPARDAAGRAAGRPDGGRGSDGDDRRDPDGRARAGCGSAPATTATDVIVDLSKNRSRRFCESGCGNRANVAAYRARVRAG